jgi:hypothetical protein
MSTAPFEHLVGPLVAHVEALMDDLAALDAGLYDWRQARKMLRLLERAVDARSSAVIARRAGTIDSALAFEESSERAVDQARAHGDSIRGVR